VIVLIPSYQPGSTLADVVRGLRLDAPRLRVVVVDDGSGPGYDAAFRAAVAEDAEVLRYTGNRGKGHALKTGLRHVLAHYPHEHVVTADSDGQHSTADILRVAERLEHGDGGLVLGGRRFVGAVPVRSRFGNAVSRRVFQLASGCAVHDTQTGLRGLPAALLPRLLLVEGERFEYESAVLLDCASAGVGIDEIPIETIYLDQNASSHFRPVVDSLRVMRPLLAFALVSLLLDLVALEVLYALTGSLLASVLGARAVSGIANFVANRRVVFRARGARTLGRDAARYLALALAVVAAGYGLLAALTALGVPLLAAKVLSETVLWVVGFQVQRRVVFRRRASAAVVPTGSNLTVGSAIPGVSRTTS
jgi:putative flippase GtrA